MKDHLVLKPISEAYKTTITNTVASMPTIPTSAVAALIQVETQDVRVRFDATTSVTAGVGGGMVLFVNTIAFPWHIIEGWDMLNRARLYRSTTSDGYINVVYLGEGQP